MYFVYIHEEKSLLLFLIAFIFGVDGLSNECIMYKELDEKTHKIKALSTNFLYGIE